MSVPALGVERSIGYPRALVEPLLWLAFVTGAMWLFVAFDLRRGTTTGVHVDGRMLDVAAALAVVLLVNASAGLALQAQPGWASRGVAVAAGLGLAISSWGLTGITNLGPGLRHFLSWGSLGAGALLVALSLTRWRYHETNGPKQLPGVVALAVVGLLGLAAVGLAWAAYGSFQRGLTVAEPGLTPGWGSLVPSLTLLAGVLSAMAAVWRREWWWAAALLIAAVVGAELAIVAQG